MLFLYKTLELATAAVLWNSLFATASYQITSTPAPTLAPTVKVNAASLDGFETVALQGLIAEASLQYRFNQADPRAAGKDTLSIVLEVPALGWTGWAVSNNGGFMVGSEAVIGLPDTGQVLKYNLGGKIIAGVQPVSQDKQTLIDASIRQEDGFTILSFTKILVEPDEIPINISGDNIFLSAWGFSNALNVHVAHGSFLLSGQAVETRKQSLWKAHGWLAAIAWGVLSPLAIAASVLRRFVPGDDLWFQFHRLVNMMVVVFTIAAFAIAVAAINQETPEGADKSHFDGTSSDGHRRIGLVIFILALLQALGGIFRPHAPPKTKSTDEENGPPESSPETKSGFRVGWEIFHKLLGLSILGLCWYQVQLGLKTYSTLFNGGDTGAALTAFWAVAGTLLALILGGYVLRLASPQNQNS